jgi:hypothetical protein
VGVHTLHEAKGGQPIGKGQTVRKLVPRSRRLILVVVQAAQRLLVPEILAGVSGDSGACRRW